MKRKKVKVQCTEMADADVSFISLVPRGAIRVPFRILKEDKSMGLDLGSLFKRAKKEEAAPAPSIGAVVVSKEADLDDLASILGEAGFTVVKRDETGEEVNILVLDEAFNAETGTVVKMNDDLAVIVCNVAKGFDPWATGSEFGDNLKAAGFFPGMCLAMDVLRDTIGNILWETPAGGNPVAAVSKAVNDFGSYVEQLASAIPTTAFKMEKLQVSKKAAGTGCAGDEEEMGEDGKPKKAKKEETEQPAGEGEQAPSGEEVVKTGEEEQPPAEGAQASEGTGEGVLTNLMTQMKEMFDNVFTPALQTVTAKMEEVTTKVASIEEQVATASALAKKADEAVSGTLLGDPPAPSKVEAQAPLIDTGLAKKQSKEGESTFGTAFKFPGLEDE